MNANESSSRLLTLDAMRGIGAFAVLLFHFLVDGKMLAPRGYLAVDFFFMLSGLVIARTYDARLRSGSMDFSTFARIRLIRLYPVFLAGLLLGAARRYGYLAFDRSDGIPLMELLASSLVEPLMLPTPFGPNLFVLNGPSWSLFFEMLASLAYAGWLHRQPPRVLVAVLAVFGSLLVFAGMQHGSLEMGLKWQWFHGGLARTGFSFTYGMLLARGLDDGMSPRVSWQALLPMAGLLAILSMEWPDGPLFDLLMVMAVAPLLIAWAARFNPPALLQPLASRLGDLSYPVYAIHYPLMFLWLFFAKRAHLPASIQFAGYVVLVWGLAWLLARFWDLPLRRRLTTLAFHREPPVSSSSSSTPTVARP